MINWDKKSTRKASRVNQKKEKTIEEQPTLSSNVFPQSRLASNQRLMNQIGNLVTLQVRGNQNWIKSGNHEILKIKNDWKMLMDSLVQVDVY